MTVSDLVYGKFEGLGYEDCILKSDMIAVDAMDGDVLFDTRKSTNYVHRYKDGEVVGLLTELVERKGTYKPILVCRVKHGSWLK